MMGEMEVFSALCLSIREGVSYLPSVVSALSPLTPHHIRLHLHPSSPAPGFIPWSHLHPSSPAPGIIPRSHPHRLTHKNCNHFVDAALERLGIPARLPG